MAIYKNFCPHFETSSLCEENKCICLLKKDDMENKTMNEQKRICNDYWVLDLRGNLKRKCELISFLVYLVTALLCHNIFYFNSGSHILLYFVFKEMRDWVLKKVE